MRSPRSALFSAPEEVIPTKFVLKIAVWSGFPFGLGEAWGVGSALLRK